MNIRVIECDRSGAVDPGLKRPDRIVAAPIEIDCCPGARSANVIDSYVRVAAGRNRAGVLKVMTPPVSMEPPAELSIVASSELAVKFPSVATRRFPPVPMCPATVQNEEVRFAVDRDVVASGETNVASLIDVSIAGVVELQEQARGSETSSDIKGDIAAGSDLTKTAVLDFRAESASAEASSD